MLQNVSIANITTSSDQLTFKFVAVIKTVDAGFGDMPSTSCTYYSRAAISPKTLGFKVGDVLSIDMSLLDIVEKPFIIPAEGEEPAKEIQLKWLYAKKQ